MQPAGATSNSTHRTEGYRCAVELLRECCTPDGFVATPAQRVNYHRVWGRDSVIMGLAGLLAGDADLIDGFRHSLETLARHQGPHGEIPSNVDPAAGRISYGGTAGLVDADLWFVIGCGAYWRQTRDDAFLEAMGEPLERVRFLLGAWEFNTRGLIYVPPTGDWADEYLQSGYVLYDQLLYLQVKREFCRLHRHRHQSPDHHLHDDASRLRHLIRANYWFDGPDPPDDAYHEVLYEKGRQAAGKRAGLYWMSFFSPFGYGYRFDAMANALAMLLGVANENQCRAVDAFIAEQLAVDGPCLLPAFHPVISPHDDDWEDLQTTFSHSFKNAPYEYQNGGLWPLVTGFYATSLAVRGKAELAVAYRDAIHAANALEKDGEPWSFPEFVHGREGTPQGTCPLGWSAAAAVIAECYCNGKRLFEEDDCSRTERV